MLRAEEYLNTYNVTTGDLLNIIAGGLNNITWGTVINFKIGDYYEGLCEDNSLMRWDLNRAARVVVRLGNHFNCFFFFVYLFISCYFFIFFV